MAEGSIVQELVTALRKCRTNKDLGQARGLHARICDHTLEADPSVGNLLVSVFVECGSLSDAHQVFNRLEPKHECCWTTLIQAYVGRGDPEGALHLFQAMQEQGVQESRFTHLALLRASVMLNCLETGYAENGLGIDALIQLEGMQMEGMPVDALIVSSSLKACGSIKDSKRGKELHALVAVEGFESDAIVGSALVGMYAKCSLLDEALETFEELPIQGVASWTALIGGYADQDLGDRAISFFEEMQEESVCPDVVTYVCGLKAYAAVGASDGGKKAHSELLKRGLERDTAIANALVDLYAKCGLLGEAQNVFTKLSNHSVVSWTALIAGYAYEGKIELVLQMLDSMVEHGLQPNDTTFIPVLAVCSHAGTVEVGLKGLELMSGQYGITPRVMHYNCVVDLIGRAGQIHEALWILGHTPSPPDLVSWKTLMGACRKSCDVGLGRHAFNCALWMEMRDPELFVSMYNIYGDAGLWAEAEGIVALRNELIVV